jgi:hypothetical protein
VLLVMIANHLKDPESNFFQESYEFTGVNIFNRCVDELESQLARHGSLKKLYFYHQHLTTVGIYFSYIIVLLTFSFPLLFVVLISYVLLEPHRSLEIQCSVQKVVHNIVVHGLEQLAVFQNVLLQLFLKRCVFELTISFNLSIILMHMIY